MTETEGDKWQVNKRHVQVTAAPDRNATERVLFLIIWWTRFLCAQKKRMKNKHHTQSYTAYHFVVMK